MLKLRKIPVEVTQSPDGNGKEYIEGRIIAVNDVDGKFDFWSIVFIDVFGDMEECTVEFCKSMKAENGKVKILDDFTYIYSIKEEHLMDIATNK